MSKKILIALVALVMLAGAFIAVPPSRKAQALPGPIQHVIVLVMENHSFDNVLGSLCTTEVRVSPCDGYSGPVTFSDGITASMKTTADLVPTVGHDTQSSKKGIQNRWDLIPGCDAASNYACVSQYQPSQIPNLANLARTYAIGDRFFGLQAVPSWGAHLDLAAATTDGFIGNNPAGDKLGGWGCDSGKSALYVPTNQTVPACVPDYTLDPTLYPNGGAVAPTPVPHVDTIMDRLDSAGMSWKLYVATNKTKATSGYIWSICPSFADCIYTNQKNNMSSPDHLLTDATNGTLPNFAFVTPNMPTAQTSQHNGASMAVGDNWIGQIANAITHGPQWSSTALFITYDDCGCFYDHVTPPKGNGLREPLVIVSPYAKPGYTTHVTSTFASLLAFAEHTYSMPPLNANDATAGDLSDAFDFTQPPLAPNTFHKTTTKLSPTYSKFLDAHPPDDDDT